VKHQPEPKKRAVTSPSSATELAPTGGPVRLGVISDNHGYLDPMVDALFAGVTHIVHAGDFVDPAVLTHLATIAPVTAVAGNVDPPEACEDLPKETYGRLPGLDFIVVHKRKRLLKRMNAGKLGDPEQGWTPNLVIFGHEHAPFAAWVDGVLFLNPGTASSPYEEDDDPTVAIVEVRVQGLAVTFAPLPRRPITES
jgi:uncharacterized protein